MATNPRKVTVTITTPDAKSLLITVSEDPVKLDPNNDGVDWEIASPDWTFTTDNNSGASTGIRIKTPRGRFTDRGGNAPIDRQHSWSRNTGLIDGKTYRYTIGVVNEKIGASVSWDPSIQNS